MKSTKIQFFIVSIISAVLFSCNQGSKRDLYPKDLVAGFELLPAEKTGIDFDNAINETEIFNHFYYSQIYNGAGVAIGDINNDDLPDIFFCGNQVSDRLYLNKGGFQFENITKKSRVARNDGWSWGVTMVDINSDGYLDIYVSRNGESINPEERKNQLYINNKDLTFTESAMAYGLADAGYSTQAVFFDMDNDGDLDMYQVNQAADQKLFIRYKIESKDYRFFTDKLYRNDNGRYKDVSSEAGLVEAFTYGLSVNASDFNNDGWTDLYVSNDYDEPDYMYYNNGDGTFKNVINEKLKHISRFSMGTDAGDINNDGLMDLMTLEMAAEDHVRSKTNMGSMSTEDFDRIVDLGKHYQYMSNTLQINNGYGSFSDVASLAGVSKTDWSWGGLFVDLDNDGLKDIIITNGVKKDVRNNDYLNIVNNLDENISNKDFFQVSKNTPSEPLTNYVYKNKGDLKFEKTTEKWGFETPSFSSGIAYGDLDNDGDLDLVINNMESSAFIYKNKATGNFLKINFEGSDKNVAGLGVKVKIYHNDNMQVLENTTTRGYLSSVEPGLFFGLGKDVLVDKIEILWPDGKSEVIKETDANNVITVKYSNAEISTNKIEKKLAIASKIDVTNLGISFNHKENEFNDFKDEILLPHKLSQNGPFTGVSDVNGDGLEDIFVGGAAGQSGVLYLQETNGDFKENLSQPWDKEKDSEDLGVLFFDVDNDGDQDLYIASGGSEFKQGSPLLRDRLYINNGDAKFERNYTALPNILESSECVKSSDVDGDGDLDLFVGTRLISGKYTFPASSYLLVNERGNFKKAENDRAPYLENIGMVTDAVFTDIDKDGDEDLIIVGEWMRIEVLENIKGQFSNSSTKYGLDGSSRGLWWSITAADIDNDGDDDYIIGNLGDNNKFKPSREHPFKVYANDFDNNGSNDIVLAKFYKNDYVPVRGRECTSQQMPYVAEKFKDFNSFASSKLIDILPKDKVDDAVIYEITSFSSIILINDNGTLVQKKLPVNAQVSPLKSSIVLDFNKDGFQDIIAIGNHYGVEVETTRYDAGFGVVLLGNGQNNFHFMPPEESGFYTPTDSRDIKVIQSNNIKHILVTNNNAPISMFKY